MGWDPKYPSQTEQFLWRLTTATVASFPLLASSIYFILSPLRFKFKEFRRFVILTLDLMVIMLISLFMVPKLAIYVMALELLRKQPERAFLTSDDMGIGGRVSTLMGLLIQQTPLTRLRLHLPAACQSSSMLCIYGSRLNLRSI